MFHSLSNALRHHPRQRRHLIRAIVGSNAGMSFLRTNDLSEVKNGKFGLDFKVVIKTGGWWFAN